MKLKSFKAAPILIATITILLACFIQSPFFIRKFDILEQLEWKTYDQRVRLARKVAHPYSTNLAFIRLDEITLEDLKQTWPYPRQLHGHLIRELSAQGVKAVAFDILFGELRPFDNPVRISDTVLIDSDEFFAEQLHASENVVLASESQVFPPPLFATNAMAVGDISADSDSDGVLRRAKAFRDDPKHGRCWHMGIILAAKELGLNLDKTVIKPGKIILKSDKSPVERIIPVDNKNFFYINWALTWDDPLLTTMPYGQVIRLDNIRQYGTLDRYREALEVFQEVSGRTNTLGDNPFAGKLVVVGSTLVGNNMSDRGATPLDKQDYLVSKHWNVANSVLTDQFIRRSPYLIDLFVIAFLGILAAVLTLKLRALTASISVIAVIIIYIAFTYFTFVQKHYWIPVVVPIISALLMTHVCLITYRVRVEQKERRRVKAVFSKIVSPNVVNELLDTEKLSLVGERRKVTVFFADVRGFTEMTDIHQARAEEYVREHRLTGVEAEIHYDKQARETLETVNLYLSTIADKVKEHNGTLDKYIGDCVMAFWGAPTANEQHALSCVRAAIDAQRGMHALNQDRSIENQKREQENPARIAAGEAPLNHLPLLSLGTGINSGTVIVGLMGSDEHIVNYTVFGREVNLASRLESVSGRGRIIIGESTFRDIERDDPHLASTCAELPAVTVKGIKNAVKIYEVPWKLNVTISSTENVDMPVF